MSVLGGRRLALPLGDAGPLLIVLQVLHVTKVTGGSFRGGRLGNRGGVQRGLQSAQLLQESRLPLGPLGLGKLH